MLFAAPSELDLIADRKTWSASTSADMYCAEIGAKVLIGINGSALHVSCSAGVTSQIIGSGMGSVCHK